MSKAAHPVAIDASRFRRDRTNYSLETLTPEAQLCAERMRAAG
jgi:hypothetical protein